MSDVPVSRTPADSALDRADLALAQGRPERAMQHVGEVLGTGQESPRAVLLAARALRALNDPTAVQYASRLCELRPGQAAPLRVRAEILLAFGARDAARPDVAEALRLDPTSAVGHALAAATARTSRGYRRSVRRAVELGPADASLLVYLAALSMQVRRLREADRLLRRALELDPGEPRALTLRSQLLTRRGPWAAGRGLADQAALVRADPGGALAAAHDRHGALVLLQAVGVMLAGTVWCLVALGSPSTPPWPARFGLLTAWGVGVVWALVAVVRSGPDGRRDLRHLVTEDQVRAGPVLIGASGLAAALAAVLPALALAAALVAVTAELAAGILLRRAATGRHRAAPAGPPSRSQLVPAGMVAGLLAVIGAAQARVAVAPPGGEGPTGPMAARLAVALIMLALAGLYARRVVVGLRRRRRWRVLASSPPPGSTEHQGGSRRR